VTRTNAARLAVLAGLAAATPALAEIIAVPFAGRVEVFELLGAPGAEAAARRLDARPSSVRAGRLARLEGAAPRALGGEWRLGGRVLVRAGGVEKVRALVADTGLAARAIDGLPGWFLVDAGRVDRAAEVASGLLGKPGIDAVEIEATPPFATRGLPNDTHFGLQWHLVNTFTAGSDIHVSGAWDLGYTGQGSTICIVESFGFLLTHPDLAPNVDLSISQPSTLISSHMTAVAGVAAAKGNNGFGVAGVAYDARLSQAIIGSNFQTANALLLLNNENDIKNNSWGPSDNGMIVPLPQVVADAIVSAADNGRGGRGVVIVWAGGNGAGSNDRVDYDPYASSRHTIAVAAVGDDDRQADYSEPGTSLLTSAYSSGGSLNITTTTVNNGYTFSFGGTSAAAPTVSGVVALMLQANPDLTWRDVQHILVESSRVIDPNDERWVVNGAGRLVSEAYGYGMVDALAAVTLAESWAGAEPETSAGTGVVSVNEAVPDNSPAGVERAVFIPDSLSIESVELIMNAQTPYIGDLEIALTSPEGTKSQFTRQRLQDGQDNLVNTVFTSMRHWGERSEGNWVVSVADRRAGNSAVWQSFEIRVHGTPLGEGPCAAVDLAEPFGLLDLSDINAFVVAFLTADPSADLAAPYGTLNEDDISEFVVLFAAGCD
jgi:subtilisin-like proprotein convertase family protein